MSIDDLIPELRRLSAETETFPCLGCGHEHDCENRGCAILRKAISALDGKQREINVLRHRHEADMRRLEELQKKRP